MSHRIRGLVAVLAAGAAAAEVVRRVRCLERQLRAERAGHRLVDHVVHADHTATRMRIEEQLAGLESLSSTNRSHRTEGGL